MTQTRCDRRGDRSKLAPAPTFAPNSTRRAEVVAFGRRSSSSALVLFRARLRARDHGDGTACTAACTVGPDMVVAPVTAHGDPAPTAILRRPSSGCRRERRLLHRQVFEGFTGRSSRGDGLGLARCAGTDAGARACGRNRADPVVFAVTPSRNSRSRACPGTRVIRSRRRDAATRALTLATGAVGDRQGAHDRRGS